jgi:hypothetical protein
MEMVSASLKCFSKEAVRFDVLMAVPMKSTNFWDAILCSLIEAY